MLLYICLLLAYSQVLNTINFTMKNTPLAITISRNSRSQELCNNATLKNVVKIALKCLKWSSVFSKVAGLGDLLWILQNLRRWNASKLLLLNVAQNHRRSIAFTAIRVTFNNLKMASSY